MSAQKRLTKSATQRMLTGTAAGIAEYLNIDPVLVRLAFVLLTMANGTGLLLYIVLAVIMPEPGTMPYSGTMERRDTADEGSSFEPLGSRGE